MKIAKFGLGALLVLTVGAAGYLRLASPDLLLVATNYAAKIVCSSTFISDRDPEDVLAVDVQAPGHPLLGYVSVDVDRDTQSVSAQLLGFAAPATATFRPGLGCANVHDAVLSEASLGQPAPRDDGLWPGGEVVAVSQDPDFAEILTDSELLGTGYRAVVVVQGGRIIGEAYAEGFDAQMPLLGWSMTKSVTATLLGRMVQSETLALDDRLTDSFAEWSADPRREIAVSDMLSMASGLTWNEGYGNVSDVTRMLYLSDDMAAFAASHPAEAALGDQFTYSSGTSTMLSRVWQDRLGDASLLFPQQALFGPLGMTSAVLEADASDTFVGSSYMYATARDWARFGQFLLQDGRWEGTQLLPPDFVEWMVAPVAASDGSYGQGHVWLDGPRGQPRMDDEFWMLGHDGQSVGVFPSHDLVIVRLGLTPSDLEYSPMPLAKALISQLSE